MNGIKYSEIKMIESPAHKFPNNEVFLSTVYLEKDSKKLTINIPESIIHIFQKELNIYLYTEFEIEKYINILEKILNFSQGTINYSETVSLVPKELTELWSDNVKINVEEHRLSKRSKLLDIYNDRNQIVSGYFKGNELLSVATDNGNGSVTVLTKDDYVNKGYATECLSKLIDEYEKRGIQLGYGTEKNNFSAIRVAEKCGMKLESYGYWIRLEAVDYYRNQETIDKLLE
ncbi:MAG: GNAT family N-acetyltransferase [Spirochaetales bacterium]|nr:GNAT family N-acetyltransferase [Spirochaetales bacterium]